MAKLFSCAFFAACFLQSGLDKVFDWKGNLGWLRPHFEKTPFRPLVPLLLGAVTALECAAGAACAAAVAELVFGFWPLLPTLALSLCCLAIWTLFVGQRIAKDYAGAAVLAAYFAVALLGLWLTSAPSAAP